MQNAEYAGYRSQVANHNSNGFSADRMRRLGFRSLTTTAEVHDDWQASVVIFDLTAHYSGP